MISERLVRVLIAEDNEDHALLAIRALRDASGGVRLDVAAVRDGAEALDYIQGVGAFADREIPHLVLLDIKMPKVDGLEVLKQLKEHPVLKSIPVVMLTASERPEDVDASYKLGANGYVAKPIGVRAFREGLRTLRRYWAELSLLPELP